MWEKKRHSVDTLPEGFLLLKVSALRKTKPWNRRQDLEREKLKRLYELHAQSLVRYLYSLSGSQDTALDLVQEVFLRAGLYDGDIRNEKSWLFQVAKNIYLNEVRSRSRKKEVPLMEDAVRSLASQDRSHEDLIRSEILETLHREGKRFYDVFLLRVDGDLSCAEIGKVLGVTERTIRRDLERIGNIVRKLGAVHD